MSKEKQWQPSDEEKLAWLNRCTRIDMSGQDGSWVFEYLIYDPESNIPPMDVRISPRGTTHLQDAVTAAMTLERGSAKK